jgi:hypothetical protein
MTKLFLAVCLLLSSTVALATDGLVIMAVEIGVSKFHRMDNSIHAYSKDNVWADSILAQDANPEQTPIIRETDAHHISVFFSNLQELLTTIKALTVQKHLPVVALNINGHGLPGAMWFPKDAATQKSMSCASWREAAAADDQENYDQYYSPVSKEDIMATRRMADSNQHMACTTGVDEWREIFAKIPDLHSAFAPDAFVHFLSCTVGLGQRGDAFTKGVAEIIGGDYVMVESSLNFGLGDWSMPQGMAFWDYVSDEQLDRDNAIYPVNRRDADIQQKGSIRMAHKMSGHFMTMVVDKQDYMYLSADRKEQRQMHALTMISQGVEVSSHEPRWKLLPHGMRVRIPGTSVYTEVVK